MPATLPEPDDAAFAGTLFDFHGPYIEWVLFQDDLATTITLEIEDSDFNYLHDDGAGGSKALVLDARQDTLTQA